MIAEHLEAAGDLHAACGWHMRAATWATYRDIAAARLSWERATRTADALPAEDPNRVAMRIAPRTMLCGIAWRVHVNVAGARFDELRAWCTAAGDKASLAIAMAGLVMDHVSHDRIREASQLASEAWTRAESVGDPTVTVGLSLVAIRAKIESAELCDVSASVAARSCCECKPCNATPHSNMMANNTFRKGCTRLLGCHHWSRVTLMTPYPRPSSMPMTLVNTW